MHATEAVRVSVIVSTYNWPRALEMALAALAAQSRLPDEVIIADDGSGSATLALLQRVAETFPVRLARVWQEHAGFRVGRARNRAIAATRCEYLVFLDGDMVPHRHFIADHLRSARRGCFTQGTRALAGPELTQTLLREGEGEVAVGPFTRGLQARRNAFRLPHVLSALMRRARGRGRKAVMSCNQGFWRDDLLAVNGFDERMIGWGREDTELAVRCYNSGLRRLQLRHTALALHLHHEPRGHGDGPNPNDGLLAETAALRRTRCDLGIDGHLAEFAVPPPDLRPRHADVPFEQVACA